MGEYGCHGNDHLFIMCVYIIIFEICMYDVYIFEYRMVFIRRCREDCELKSILIENLIKLHTHMQRRKLKQKTFI